MRLLPELMPAFSGVFPAVLVTVSAEGLPNLTNIARVWYIDDEHVAVANQMLHKTMNNLEQHPAALIKLVNPKDFCHWELGVHLTGAYASGPDYDRIRDDLQTIIWMAGADEPVLLRSVLLFRIDSIRVCAEEAPYVPPAAETYSTLLKVMAEELGAHRLSYWTLHGDPANVHVQVAASIGVPGAGTNDSAFEPMRRLAMLTGRENRVVRLNKVRSQLNYIRTLDIDQEHKLPLRSHSFLGIPIRYAGQCAGMICCEEDDHEAEPFERFDERYLLKLSSMLGELLQSIGTSDLDQHEAMIKQTAERARLQWNKEQDPFHSVLSARERQVCAYVAQGCTNAQIAEILFISKRTVTTHMERIFQKLNVNSRASLTRYVLEHQLLPADSKPVE